MKILKQIFCRKQLKSKLAPINYYLQKKNYFSLETINDSPFVAETEYQL